MEMDDFQVGDRVRSLEGEVSVVHPKHQGGVIDVVINGKIKSFWPKDLVLVTRPPKEPKGGSRWSTTTDAQYIYLGNDFWWHIASETLTRHTIDWRGEMEQWHKVTDD